MVNRLTVKDIMIRDVIVAQEDWALDRLAEFFIENQISGAPVVNNYGELVGVVSLTDIVRNGSLHDTQRVDGPPDYYYSLLEDRYAREEIAALRIRSESVAIVRDIMTPMIFQVSENATPQEVADAMIKGHIHRVFVTRNKQVIGVVSALDMLRIIRDG